MKRLIFLLLIIFNYKVFAADYGLVLSQQLLLEGNKETDFTSNTSFIPWFSAPVGDFDLNISAGITASYRNKFVMVPELHKLELSAYTFPLFNIRAGRIAWQDYSGFTAKGIFDGADVQFKLGTVLLNTALLYTGLLYKETANINITPGDPKDYNLKFDWSDFGNTYFAPGRFITSFHGEFPGFPYMRGKFYSGLLFQIDLSDAEKKLSSYYFFIRNVMGYKQYDLDVSGAVSFSNGPALAFSMEGGWQTGFLRDRLSLGLHWASGQGSNMAAFFPITREAQGVVLKHWFSGIMVIRTKYEARLLPELSVHGGLRYFLRTDDVTFADQYIEKDSYSLGLELDAGFLYVPMSDFSLFFGSGIFIPQMGGAMRSDSPVRWSLNLGAIFSL